MIELDEFAKDQPLTPLEKAVWWIEYVLRHKNTERLKGIFTNTPFYRQMFDLDVLAVFAAASLAVFVVVLKFTRLLFKKLIK